MKQVTMESVKERIARIESGAAAIKPGGMELSIQHEFELACLRELLTVTEQVRLLTEQRDAVVAEFAKFKTVHPQPFGPEMMKALEAYEWHQDDVPETGMLNAFFILRDSIVVETPATSAILDSLRAEGVEMLAESYEAAAKDSDDFKFINHCNIKADQARDFARQLRESKGANHG